MYADLLHNAAVDGDVVAIEHDGRRCTYAELADAARRTASGMRALGVGPGDTVGIMLPNAIEWPIALYGANMNGSIVVPGNIGGLHWGGAVWDPTTRLLIAPVNRIPAVVRLVPRADFAEARRTHPERETTEQAGTPYAMSRQFFLSPAGRPCTAPPWGELVAIDLKHGKLDGVYLRRRDPLLVFHGTRCGSSNSPT